MFLEVSHEYRPNISRISDHIWLIFGGMGTPDNQDSGTGLIGQMDVTTVAHIGQIGVTTVATIG